MIKTVNYNQEWKLHCSITKFVKNEIRNFLTKFLNLVSNYFLFRNFYFICSVMIFIFIIFLFIFIFIFIFSFSFMFFRICLLFFFFFILTCYVLLLLLLSLLLLLRDVSNLVATYLILFKC